MNKRTKNKASELDKCDKRV